MTYNVYLQYAPVANEIISISFGASQFSLSASSLTFTSGNYYTSQTVTVTVLKTSTVGQFTSTISHSNTNMIYSSDSAAISNSGVFTVTLYHNINAYVIVSSSPIMQEGKTATYQIYLSSSPSSTVSIAITGQSSLAFSPSSLSFTSANYNTPVTITVTSSVSSVNEIGTNSYAITHTLTTSDSSYIGSFTIPTTVYAYVVKTLNPSVLISDDVVFQESLGGAYLIMLTSMPASDVNIILSTTGTTISFSPSILTFTADNFGTPQRITLKSVVNYTPRSLKYSITIVHTVSSSDSNYNGIVPLPSSSITVTAVNPCKAGMYSWPPGSGTCAPCPLGYQCPTLYQDKIACSSNQYSPLGVWNCLGCPPGHSCTGLTMPVPCADGYTSS